MDGRNERERVSERERTGVSTGIGDFRKGKQKRGDRSGRRENLIKANRREK